MCYTQTIDHKGLKFSISNCFGFGFDWNDEEFIKAVNNKDERLWQILKWAANGGAEEYDTAVSFEESISLYKRESPSELLRTMRYEDEKEGKLDELLSNSYLSEQTRQIIIDYRSGELGKQARLSEPKKKINYAQKGVIYLLKSGEYYKIGKTKNLPSRIDTLAVGVRVPFDIQLIHSFKSNDYSSAESGLHKTFASKRTEGEWFSLSQEDVEFISSLEDGQL